MRNDDEVKDKVLKLLQKMKETDTFEISIIIKKPIEEVNAIMEEISDDGTVLIIDHN